MAGRSHPPVLRPGAAAVGPSARSRHERDRTPPLPTGPCDAERPGRAQADPGAGRRASTSRSTASRPVRGAGPGGQQHGATDGRFAFSGISNQAGTMYIVGARYQDVPFGQRVTFEAGPARSRGDDRGRGREPTDVSGLAVVQSLIKLDWLGSQLRWCRESHHVRNPGEPVVAIPETPAESEPARPVRSCPPAHRTSTTVQGAASGNGTERDGDTACASGAPSTPATGEVGYQYVLDVAGRRSGRGSDAVRLPLPHALPDDGNGRWSASSSRTDRSPSRCAGPPRHRRDRRPRRADLCAQLELPGVKPGGAARARRSRSRRAQGRIPRRSAALAPTTGSTWTTRR